MKRSRWGWTIPTIITKSASINPQYDYRITGKRGTVDYLGFGTVINRYSSGGGMKTDGFQPRHDQ